MRMATVTWIYLSVDASFRVGTRNRLRLFSSVMTAERFGWTRRPAWRWQKLAWSAGRSGPTWTAMGCLNWRSPATAAPSASFASDRETLAKDADRAALEIGRAHV